MSLRVSLILFPALALATPAIAQSNVEARVGKLERIVGPFTTDPHLRLDVALALQVVQMRGI